MKEDHGEHGNSTQSIDVPSILHNRNNLPRWTCAEPLSISPICVTLAPTQTPFCPVLIFGVNAVVAHRAIAMLLLQPCNNVLDVSICGTIAARLPIGTRRIAPPILRTSEHVRPSPRNRRNCEPHRGGAEGGVRRILLGVAADVALPCSKTLSIAILDWARRACTAADCWRPYASSGRPRSWAYVTTELEIIWSQWYLSLVSHCLLWGNFPMAFEDDYPDLTEADILRIRVVAVVVLCSLLAVAFGAGYLVSGG